MNELHARPHDLPLSWYENIFTKDIFIEIFCQLEEDDRSALMQTNRTMHACCLKLEHKNSMQLQKIIDIVKVFFTFERAGKLHIKAQSIQLPLGDSLPKIQDHFYDALTELRDLFWKAKAIDKKCLIEIFKDKNLLLPYLGLELPYKKVTSFGKDLLCEPTPFMQSLDASVLEQIKTTVKDIERDPLFPKNISMDSYQLIDNCKILSKFLKLEEEVQNPLILPDSQQVRQIYQKINEYNEVYNNEHISCTAKERKTPHLVDVWQRGLAVPLLQMLAVKMPQRMTKFLEVLYRKIEPKEYLDGAAHNQIRLTRNIVEQRVPLIDFEKLPWFERRSDDFFNSLKIQDILLHIERIFTTYDENLFESYIKAHIAQFNTQNNMEAIFTIFNLCSTEARKEKYFYCFHLNSFVPFLCQEKNLPEAALKVIEINQAPDKNVFKSKWALTLATSFAKKGEFDSAYQMVLFASEPMRPLIINKIEGLRKKP